MPFIFNKEESDGLRFGGGGLMPNSGADGWSFAGATFDYDYVNNRALGLASPAAGMTISNSNGWVESNGIWQAPGTNTLRIGLGKGLRCEEARTNSIRNNSMQGATVGVIGSGGALPTNWSISNGTGLTKTVIGFGTLNGLEYIDLEFSGTTGDANGTAINFETTTNIAALNGQFWSNSAFLALVTGSFTNVGSIFLAHSQRDAGGAILSDLNGSSIKASIPSSTTTFTRCNNTQTLNNASVAFNQPRLVIQAASGVAVNYCIRIVRPQLEQLTTATGRESSPIRTTTAAVARTADNAFIANATNFVSFTEGWLYLEWTELFGSTSGITRVGLTITTASNSVTARITSGNGRPLYEIISGGVTEQQSTGIVTPTIGVTYKLAARWKGNDGSVRMSPSLSGDFNDASVNVPTGTPQIAVGSTGSANYFNADIRRVAGGMQALNDNQLAAMVAA